MVSEELIDKLGQVLDRLDKLNSVLEHIADKLDQLELGEVGALEEAIWRLDNTLYRASQDVAILRPARRPGRKEPE